MTGADFTVLATLLVAVGILAVGAGVSAGDGSVDAAVTPSESLTPTPTNQTTVATNETVDNTSNTTNDTLVTPTDTTDDTLDSTTDTANDPGDTTSDTTNDTLVTITSTTNDTLDSTSDTTNETVDGTTDTTNDTLDSTTDTTDETLVTTSDTANDTVDISSDAIDETIETVQGSTTDTPGGTVELTDDAIETLEATTGDTRIAVDDTGDETFVDVAVTESSPTSGTNDFETDGRDSTSPVGRSTPSSGDSTIRVGPGSPQWERDQNAVAERSSAGRKTVPGTTSGAEGVRDLAETLGAFARSLFGGPYGPHLEPTVTLTLSTLAAGLVFSGSAASTPILCSWRPLTRHAAGSARRSMWSNRSFRVGPLPGYSRYDESDPLENEVRSEIYDIVIDAPGIHRARVAQQTNTSPSTVRYHTRVLERERLVETEKVGGKQRLYPLGFDDVELAAALESDSSAAVVAAVVDDGPLSVSEIAEALGRSPGTVSYHLDRLEDADLVEREKLGNTVLVHAPTSVCAAVTTEYGIETT